MARKLVVEIVGDARSLEKAFAKSSKSASTFGGKMDKTASKTKRSFGGLSRGAGLLTGAIGAAGLTAAARAAFGEFSEGQKVMAQTNAVIKSTGKQANVSAKHVAALADSTLKLTGIDDEATQAAENWLLTFKNIRNEQGKSNKIFDRATRVVADLATAQADGAVPSSEQMVAASKLVGKALDDPTRGLTALRRVGISFTEQQQEQIKGLVASGKSMEAQKVIIKELNDQVGGRAAATGKTFVGQWAIIRETLLNLSAVLVEKLMPSIQRVLGQAAKWLSSSKNQDKILNAVESAASALASGLRTLKTVFGVLARVVGGNKNAIIALVAAYTVFKTAQFAATITRMAQSFGLLTTAVRTNTGATRTATLANRTFAASFLGKAGIAAGAIYAGYELSKLIRKIPGWDKAMKKFGSTVYDVFADVGLVDDPMKQFEGKRMITPADIRGLRKASAAGRSIGELAIGHPRLARRDIEVAVGARARPGINIEHFHSTAQNPQQMERELIRRNKQRAHQRKSRR